MLSKVKFVVSVLVLSILFFVVYVMTDMFIATISVSNNISTALYEYFGWIYIYISVLGSYTRKYGLVVSVGLFIVYLVYSLYKKTFNKLKITLYLFSILYCFLLKKVYTDYIDMQLELVDKSQKLGIYLNFNYVPLGIILNISNFIVVVILLLLFRRKV